jgi:predicted Rossmann fold nucleotide-binding protein DprA/Smf involved in DNA uptake
MASPKRDTSEKRSELKELRRIRKEHIARINEHIKEQKRIMQQIKSSLQEEPKTVPEIAEETNIEPSQVLWFLASLRKYGEIEEEAKKGDYFQYALVQPKSEEAGT